jgi:hypothetical protein
VKSPFTNHPIQQLNRILLLFWGQMRIALGHGQRLVAQQFLQLPNVHSPHGQMAGVGVPEIVKPEVRDPCLPARRSEAVLYIPDVAALPIPENIA